MGLVRWTMVGSPGSAIWARATRDATVIAVGTSGGHIYLRRRDGAAWRWEPLATPPGARQVIDAALLTAAEGSGPVTPVVVGDDLRVWLHRPEATPTPWIDLAGPDPNVDELPTHFAGMARRHHAP